MIYYVAEADNDLTMKMFVRDWARDLAPRVQSINTHQLAMATRMPAGTYIFTDMERQPYFQRELQCQIFEQLREDGHSRLLNHPTKALGRFELIKKLHELGVNDFRAFRPLEVPDDLRFPVFIRMERDHGGSHTPLLDSWGDYEEAVLRLALASRPLDQMLTIEFVDVSNDSGLYAKYGAYRVGDRIVPRSVYFGNEWMQKAVDKVPQWPGKEKWEYVRGMSFRDEVMRVFEIANIEFGRIDYGIKDGRIVVWEVNTNPRYAHPASSYPPEELEHHQWVARQIEQALQEIDIEPTDHKIPVSLGWKMKAEA